MRYLNWLSASLLFTIIMFMGCSTPEEPAQELKPRTMDWSLVAKTQPASRWYWLFDGETLNSWRPHDGDAEWQVAETALTTVAAGTPSHIATIANYDNFALTIDFYAEAGHDAGVIIRGPFSTDRETPISPESGYEINISDQHPDGYGAGSILGLIKHQPASSISDRWNTLEITAKSDHIVVKLNQQITADVHDSTHVSGIIALQASGTGQVKYRNIKFRDL